MKSAPFAYASPGSLDEAVATLAEHGDEAKVLAGGQSLVPMLALRIAQPELLVDLGRVDGLDGVRALDDGGLAIGAMTRMRALETDPLVRERAPLAAEAAPLVAHRAIRNRGTVGGSIAHADPAAELPAVLLALGATVVARGPAGERSLPAATFFHGLFETALAPDEVLVELRFPPPRPGSGSAFAEIARRHGDFAMAGAAVTLTLDGGRCVDAGVALIGVADRPVASDTAREALVGRAFDEDVAREAAAAAVAPLSPGSDIHAGGEYRRHLAEVLVRRALVEAAGRAGG